MWPKTITAFLGGLLLSVSMMLSLYLLIPLAIDIKLLIGYWLALAFGLPQWCISIVLITLKPVPYAAANFCCCQ